jgi:hypothetical protein
MQHHSKTPAALQQNSGADLANATTGIIAAAAALTGLCNDHDHDSGAALAKAIEDVQFASGRLIDVERRIRAAVRAMPN